MVNETNEGLHHNHRARMREKLFEHGVETFHDHELLEMLLYACESRRNTNDTAHALLNRFGSLNGVFTATPEALSTVPGIKDAATALIAVARELMKRVENERTVVPNRFESREQMYEYILRLFKFSAVEELYMLMFDADDRFIDCELINRGTTQSVQMDTRKMVEEATKRKAEKGRDFNV